MSGNFEGKKNLTPFLCWFLFVNSLSLSLSLWLGCRYGKEIDEHDFVVRFNVITKPYKESVGSFASALFIKPNYQDTPFARDLDPTMFNFFPK